MPVYSSICRVQNWFNITSGKFHISIMVKYMHFNWRQISSNWYSGQLQVQEIRNEGKKEREKRHRFMSCKRWVAKSEICKIYVRTCIVCWSYYIWVILATLFNFQFTHFIIIMACRCFFVHIGELLVSDHRFFTQKKFAEMGKLPFFRFMFNHDYPGFKQI